MRPVATNVPGGSQCLFSDDLNKRIAQISSMNYALCQNVKSNNQQGRYNHSSTSVVGNGATQDSFLKSQGKFLLSFLCTLFYILLTP